MLILASVYLQSFGDHGKNVQCFSLSVDCQACVGLVNLKLKFVSWFVVVMNKSVVLIEIISSSWHRLAPNQCKKFAKSLRILLKTIKLKK